MEDFLASYILVPLLLVPLSFYLASFMRFRSEKTNLPPGSRGWPVLGENLMLASLGPEKFVGDRMRKYSTDVFQTSIYGAKVAVLCGSEGHKFQFANANENKIFTRWVPDSLKKITMLPEDRRKKVSAAFKQSVHQVVLKPEALKQRVSVMDAVARKHMDQYWVNSTEAVKVLPLAKKYTFELACIVLLNMVEKENIKRLAIPFYSLGDSLFSMPIKLPGTAYSRAKKGGKMVREELMRIIKERREEIVENKETEGRDLLSKMLLMRDEDGEFLSDMEISLDISGLLLASFDSTSSAITAVIKYLAQLPHIYEQVYEEQMEIKKSKGPDELLTWDDIEKMKYSWNVARESLRLMPPSQGMFREAKAEFTYAGFTIPKGWKTFWTVHSTHKNPDYFPEPEKFDPSRFEGSGPAPYTFVPFGGGPSICPGREYARLEVLVFMYNVVTRFKLEKAIPDEKNVYINGSAIPAHGLPVNLTPHKN